MSVVMIARDWPSDESINYASPWAGAHGRHIPAITPEARQHEELSKITFNKFREQAAAEPACGIEFKKGCIFLAKPSSAYINLEGGYGQAEGFRLLDPEDWPRDMGIAFGCEYLTWSLNSPVYCAYLLRKFRVNGGKTISKTLVSAQEALSVVPNARILVNCSGVGFDDPLVFPTRGKKIPKKKKK